MGAYRISGVDVVGLGVKDGYDALLSGTYSSLSLSYRVIGSGVSGSGYVRAFASQNQVVAYMPRARLTTPIAEVSVEFETVFGKHSRLRSVAYGTGEVGILVVLQKTLLSTLALGLGVRHIGLQSETEYYPQITSNMANCDESGWCGEYIATLNYGECTDNAVRLIHGNIEVEILNLVNCTAQLVLKLY